jgi:hypothetical protein
MLVSDHICHITEPYKNDNRRYMREHKSKFHLIDLLQQSLNAVCSVFMLIDIALFSELELRVILYQEKKKHILKEANHRFVIS